MTKYAVIQTGGKQYRVVEGDVIDVELLEGDNKNVEFDVLFFNDGTAVKMGEPVIPGFKAAGEVLDYVRGPKVIAYKYKQRQRSTHKKVGHRQDYQRVRILHLGDGIISTPKVETKKSAPKAESAPKTEAAPKVAAKKAAPKKAAPKKEATTASEKKPAVKKPVAKKKKAVEE